MKIPSRLAPKHFVVEARVRTDQFDGMVPKEGVFVYEVMEDVNVQLLTAPALSKGDTYDNPEEKLKVTVDEALAGDFTVHINAHPESQQVTAKCYWS